MKCSRVTLAWISGGVWVAVGVFLMTLGMNFLTVHLEGGSENVPLIQLISPYVGGGEQATVVLIGLALYIGFLKGKHVLGKSARQGIQRLQTFPEPTSLTKIYSAKYYILLGAMIGLGISIKYFGIPLDVRGVIDLAIGTALIQGAMVYFRSASSLKPIPEQKEV